MTHSMLHLHALLLLLSRFDVYSTLRVFFLCSVVSMDIGVGFCIWRLACTQEVSSFLMVLAGWRLHEVGMKKILLCRLFSSWATRPTFKCKVWPTSSSYLSIYSIRRSPNVINPVFGRYRHHRDEWLRDRDRVDKAGPNFLCKSAWKYASS